MYRCRQPVAWRTEGGLTAIAAAAAAAAAVAASWAALGAQFER